MKTIEKIPVKSACKLAILSLLFLAFSCSPETELETVRAQSESAKNAVKSELKVLATGAHLKGANGVDIGADGHLYIASVLGGEIIVMNKQNGKIIRRLGRDMGILSPDDLVFGPDGSLYWTDLLVGEVGRMTPDGVVTKQFVAPGVNPITFSPEGRLFVALDFLGDGLYELDPNLTEPPRPIIIASPENPFPLGFLNAFDFCEDGYLYGPLFAAGLVIRVNVDPPFDHPSTNPFVDGIAEVVATGLEIPASTKFGPDGMLYVLDQTGEVFKINISTGEKTLFTHLEPGLDNMVFNTDGTLYITNADHGWVVEILKSGQARTISRGGIIAPQGLAVLPGSDNKDDLYVADQFNLRQFNSRSGKQENIFKGFLVPEENVLSLVSPQTVSSDGNNLLVSSWFAGAVQVFDPQAGQVLEHYPMSVPIDAVRFKGDIIVSDLGLGGVVWTSDQSIIIPIDNATVFAPGGLATDGETVWVADWGSGIVWQIDFEGRTPSAPVVVASGLLSPEGLAYEKDGSLLVVESGALRLSRIDLSSGEVTTIAEDLELNEPGLEGYPPTWSFDGVAVGPSGDIYVSGGGANVIYRIQKN